MYQIGLIGRKLGMTQIFTNTGIMIPITLIEIPPCTIVQKKLSNLNGYNAIQLGCFNIKNNKISKPLLGYFAKYNIKPVKYLKEFKLQNIQNFFIGQILSLKNIDENKKLQIEGITIGKGNAGNIKRNNFKRGPMTHGSKHHRLQGSLGAGTTPSRVFPGKKMAGRLGNSHCSIKGLSIVYININNNILFL